MIADKKQTLHAVAELVKSGNLSKAELMDAFNGAHGKITHADSSIQKHALQTDERRTNAADLLYFVGALVVYGAIVTFFSQSWDDMSTALRIMFTLGLGILLWMVSWVLLRNRNRSEQSDGVGSALLLIGSLSVITGVFVSLGEAIDLDDDSQRVLILAAILVIAGLHFAMDMLVRKTVTVVMANLALIAAYGVGVGLIFGDSIATNSDFWLIVSALAGVLTIGLGAFTRKYQPDRVRARTLLWALGGFGALSALYALTFSDSLGWLWQLVFPAVLYFAFVFSIKLHSRNFLYSGAFFLFCYVISMSFTYFGSGLGAAGALLFGGFAIIGSGVLVQHIRKKYF